MPAGVEDLLWQTTLMAPLSAVQQAHAAIRDGGESPARLGALVRGYANLGQLCSFQWWSGHKAMTARSLLYAQRMVHAAPDAAGPYYHRAYAFTLCGLHAEALADLDHAAKLDPAGAARPAWAELLGPACHCDGTALAAAVGRGGRAKPLASLLLFLSTENCGSLSRLLEVGQGTLDANPACFDILDGMTAQAGVASSHDLTERAPAILFASLPADLARLPALPPATGAVLARGAAVDPVHQLAAVCASLVSDADAVPAEPSMALAGRVLQETNFVHVERRAHFMADMWGVDAADYIAATAPLIAGSPAAGVRPVAGPAVRGPGRGPAVAGRGRRDLADVRPGLRDPAAGRGQGAADRRGGHPSPRGRRRRDGIRPGAGAAAVRAGVPGHDRHLGSADAGPAAAGAQPRLAGRAGHAGPARLAGPSPPTPTRWPSGRPTSRQCCRRSPSATAS